MMNEGFKGCSILLALKTIIYYEKFAYYSAPMPFSNFYFNS